MTSTLPKPEARFHTLSIAEVLAVERVERDDGLSSAEVAARRAAYGPNRFAEARREPRWRAFARQYADPMQIVLLCAGVGSLYPLKQLGTGLLLLALTLFNAVLGLRQEGKAAAAVAALQQMMVVKARVRRDGRLTEVPAEDLVPGDVVLVEAGDVVPADGRLVRAARLEVDESALTGESVPVVKDAATVPGNDAALGDRVDMVYMHTNVTRGTGEVVVTATGMATEVGAISGLLQRDEGAETPLTRQLARLTDQILVVAGAALLVSVLVNLARGNTFQVVFTAAVAFAVSAIPTGLPAVVTTMLSLGTQALARANAIVKRLRSTETLGSTSAINSDKTGTLTLNEMTAVELTLPGRHYTVTGTGYGTDGDIRHTGGEPDVPLEPYLLPLALACDAVVADGALVGDPTEGALVVLAEKGHLDVAATRQRYPRLAEVPFDAAYKLMATFHRCTDDAGRDVVRAYVKGAPDQLLARAAAVDVPDRPGQPPVVIDEPLRDRYLAENARLAGQGLRVMATARKDFPAAGFDPGADLLGLLDGLTLLALVGIVDPPRPQAKSAIATAKAAGIQVRMITGDHAVTAAAIAGQLGIEGRAITGAEFAAMSDEQLAEQIDGIGVIARVTPEHKVRLVETLRAKGHIVAMTGDGVNDAPALKRADIGIAMGITGTEVSKEASAMILTDDDFATIVKAVAIGRGLYDNLQKYVLFQMGALIGFIATFLGASLLNVASGVPLLPLQTLWVNFTTQVFQAVGLGSGKPDQGLMSRRPRRADAPLLPGRTLLGLTVIGLVMGATTLAVIWWAQRAHGLGVARTMGLTTFSVLNLVLSVSVRCDLRSVFTLDTFDDRRFVATTGLSVLAIVVAAEAGVAQRILGTVGLDLRQWLICVVAAVPLLVVTELRALVLRHRAAEAARADRSAAGVAA
ncbi:cation-translocating P-type ATPase [Dactylosporangium aurantiacum]|uniref:cation-translocating P-type ATPase n=1 Tax=Dactylosporangium aurantiacum TaxID=35754 RepID=UPI000527F63F|nr:cation-transporting P-type ATPase [Dactylosporangium aurantiacum]MDG6101788.1 cation-transporting P-type ATPase [Dactylosporangium aurantiacum]